MSNLAHTPGPWIVRRLNTGLWIATDSLTPLARMRTAASCGPDQKARREADAQLMAAAPTQLTALCHLTDATERAYEAIYQSLPDYRLPDWFMHFEHAAKQARAVINATTGA